MQPITYDRVSFWRDFRRVQVGGLSEPLHDPLRDDPLGGSEMPPFDGMVKGGRSTVEIFTITEAGTIHIDFACTDVEPPSMGGGQAMVTLVDITTTDGRVGVMDHFSDVVLERRIRPGLCRLAVEATQLPSIDVRPFWGEDLGETYRVTMWPKDEPEPWVTRRASAHAVQRLGLGFEWPRPPDWQNLP